MSIRVRAAAAMVMLQAGSIAGVAQQPKKPDPAQRTPRSLIFAALGAATGAAVSGVYAFTENDNSSPGNCTTGSCVLTVASVSGLLVGFMIGREFDNLHALRYRGGVPLYPKGDAIALGTEPFAMAIRDTLIAVGSRNGVQIISNGASLKLAEKRASAIRGIAALDLIPGVGAIVLGSPSGFYLYPPRTGPGMLLREGETSALISSPERVYFATGTRIESAPFSADTLREWPGIEVGARVLSMTFDDSRGLLWAATDTLLLSYRPAGDSLVAVGSTRLPGRARNLAIAANMLSVAMGEAGVVLYDVSDPAQPRERGRWSKARFVYSSSIAGDRVFAAAGLDGVYVLTVTPTGLDTFGLARELGFATLLTSRGAYTFLVDRATNSLRRIPSNF